MAKSLRFDQAQPKSNVMPGLTRYPGGLALFWVPAPGSSPGRAAMTVRGALKYTSNNYLTVYLERYLNSF